MEHRVHVARARKFLRSHVGEEIQLVAVARAAGASMFHLARLYRAITGDTVGRALTRLRIERAAQRLVETPLRSISSIALEVGFRTPSSLNKAFRAALGMSPTGFRAAAPARRRKALQQLQVTPPLKPAYTLAGPRRERIDDLRVVYVREQGPYSQVSAPLAWAQLELRIGSTPLVGCQRVAASYDDPATVSVDLLRYDAGVIVGPAVDPPAGTQVAIWPGGMYLVFEYRGDYRFIADAYIEIFATHQIAKRRGSPCRELYRDEPETAELWIPIEERTRHA